MSKGETIAWIISTTLFLLLYLYTALFNHSILLLNLTVGVFAVLYSLLIYAFYLKRDHSARQKH